MKNKKKILFIHNSVPEYRIEFWKLLGKKVELYLLITSKNLEKKIYNLEKDVGDLNIYYLHEKNYLLNMGNLNYDAIILPPDDSFKNYFLSKKILKIASKKNIPCFFWNERWELNNIKKTLTKSTKDFIHRFMIKDISKRCDGLIASGTLSSEFLINLGFSANNIKIAIDSSTSPEVNIPLNFEKKYGILDSDNLILFLGRVIEQKGPKVLLEAFDNIQKKDTWLMICGDGDYLESCIDYVKENNIKKVIFTGKIQPYLRAAYYKRADIFVIPSIPLNGVIESWGLTVNESLEQGTPVIATDIVGASKDLITKDSGIIISPNSEKELTLAINNLLTKNLDRNKIKKIYYDNDVKNMANNFYIGLNL